MKGVYQRLTEQQVALFENQFHQKTAVWGVQAMERNMNCGSYMMYGPVKGKGETYAVVKVIGPFLGPS